MHLLVLVEGPHAVYKLMNSGGSSWDAKHYTVFYFVIVRHPCHLVPGVYETGEVIQ